MNTVTPDVTSFVIEQIIKFASTYEESLKNKKVSNAMDIYTAYYLYVDNCPETAEEWKMTEPQHIALIKALKIFFPYLQGNFENILLTLISDELIIDVGPIPTEVNTRWLKAFGTSI